MLKIVSNNIIDLLKHFGYTHMNKNDYIDFINSKVPVAISGLVTAREDENQIIDQSLLDKLENAIDELISYRCDQIDLDDINKRLS